MLGNITCCDFAIKQPNQAFKQLTQAGQKAIADLSGMGKKPYRETYVLHVSKFSIPYFTVILHKSTLAKIMLW